MNSLTISGLLTLDMHALNNEGAEGNTMMTRMVDIVDQQGQKHTVNAISGDMFKHMIVGHLIEQAKHQKLALCAGCAIGDPNRICFDRTFTENPDYNDKTGDGAILTDVIQRCSVDDTAGILITSKLGGKARSIARKSCVECGWLIGRPGSTVTESYFHAKYVPEGREKGSGSGENLGQNIFHRPASSGQYAVVLNIDYYRIGRNDITLQPALKEDERTARIGAVNRAILSALVKPTGAHRNSQNPHLLDFTGMIATSGSSIPAPTVSALNPDFLPQIKRMKEALNALEAKIELHPFGSLADFAERMAQITVPK